MRVEHAGTHFAGVELENEPFVSLKGEGIDIAGLVDSAQEQAGYRKNRTAFERVVRLLLAAQLFVVNQEHERRQRPRFVGDAQKVLAGFCVRVDLDGQLQACRRNAVSGQSTGAQPSAGEFERRLHVDKVGRQLCLDGRTAASGRWPNRP